MWLNKVGESGKAVAFVLTLFYHTWLEKDKVAWGKKKKNGSWILLYHSTFHPDMVKGGYSHLEGIFFKC